MESDLDPKSSQERPDLSTVRIVSTNYAALMDNRKKHSYANVILQILYRLTAFRCYLLDLVGQTVPFSKVTQCMNGLLPILRSMDTQAITYPYSVLQVLVWEQILQRVHLRFWNIFMTKYSDILNGTLS